MGSSILLKSPLIYRIVTSDRLILGVEQSKGRIEQPSEANLSQKNQPISYKKYYSFCHKS